MEGVGTVVDVNDAADSGVDVGTVDAVLEEDSRDDFKPKVLSTSNSHG